MNPHIKITKKRLSPTLVIFLPIDILTAGRVTVTRDGDELRMTPDDAIGYAVQVTHRSAFTRLALADGYGEGPVEPRKDADGVVSFRIPDGVHVRLRDPNVRSRRQVVGVQKAAERPGRYPARKCLCCQGTFSRNSPWLYLCPRCRQSA